MSDLIHRLRNTPNWMRQDFKTWKDGCNVYDRAPFEAADELLRLRGELAEARRALRVYGRHLDSCGDADAYNHAEVAACGCGFDTAMDSGNGPQQA